MSEHDKRRLKRHAGRIKELGLWRNAREKKVWKWSFTTEGGETREINLGDFWPEIGLPVFLSAEAKVPDEWAGEPVELELWLGGEGFVRLSTGVSGGLNPFHRNFPVAEKARGGEEVRIEAEVVPRSLFGSNVAEPRIEHASLVVPETEVRALGRDLALIHEACELLGDHEVVPHLLDSVDTGFAILAGSWPSETGISLTRYLGQYARSTDGAPWSLPEPPRRIEPLPEETREAVREVRRLIAGRMEEIKEDYPPVGKLALTGHAHLDLAWLWPVSETRRKGRRTFASVLSLMDRYEDFTFNQSSAQLYEWIERDAPELFRRVRQRVGEGRWEPVGGSWTEPDCQLPGGESFVRQLLYGQRYFEEKFGRRSTVAWLPDAFGFSPSIPQLLRGAGMDGFFTYKMNWSETNHFPHDLFLWEGIDCTSLVAHDFENPGQDYNGNVTPRDLFGTWRNFEGKRRHPESIFSFGWGDGGGGPSEEMLENYARLKDFPALPRLRMTGVDEFFATLPREGLPKWVGELYLELHRGTLTSQALVKKLNREAEHRLLEAEVFTTIASLGGVPYPHRELEAAWKLLLLNQFHDILPGSSVSEVYEDAHRQLGEAVETAERLRDKSLSSLPDSKGAPDGAKVLVVANAGLHPRLLTALLPVDSDGVRPGCALEVADSGERALTTQETREGFLLYAPELRVPGLGHTKLFLREVPREGEDGRSSPPSSPEVVAGKLEGGTFLENELLRVEVGADGTLHRVYDREMDRDILDGRANQLWAYTDKPREWEAWDVDEDYELEGEEVSGVERVEVVEGGPLLAAVRIVRRWRGSKIEQTYKLHSGSRRLDVETRVGWHERQILLRALFPLAVRSHEATFETMFGVVKRPTHRNTSWDEARFEVSGHRFCDLSEPGYGVALLNDGKYGHSARANVLGLSLLGGPLYPDPLADEGDHHFTYSLFPHPGDWTEAGVAREALALNSPLVAVEASGGAFGGVPSSEAGFVGAEGVELLLGALKLAEDGESLILRLYERHGARGSCGLRFAGRVERAERVNLLEESEESGLEVRNGVVRFSVRPFEVLTLRVELDGM
ncbi:MAG: alpha-mannosidase [Rubrobacteraceae bacterium]